MPVQPLSVSPASVTIPVPPQSASIAVTNARGSVAAAIQNPLLAALTVSGSVVTITPIASGQSTIDVTTPNGNASVPYAATNCTPSFFTYALVSPTNGANGVSPTTGTIEVSTVNAPGADGAAMRVVSSSGKDVVTAAHLQAASPPAGAASNQEFFTFSIPTMPAGQSFTVQAYISSLPCLQPSDTIVGTFST